MTSEGSSRRSDEHLHSWCDGHGCQPSFAQHPDVVLLLDRTDRHIVAANPAAVRFYGRAETELRSLSLDDLRVASEDAPADPAAEPADPSDGAEAADAPAWAGRSERHRSAGGRIVEVDVHISPIDVDGRVLDYCVVVDHGDRDGVTALQDSAELARNIVNYAPLGVAVADSDGRLVRVNRRFASILGYAEHELLGRTVTSLSHPDDQELSRRRIEQLWGGEVDAYESDKRYVRRDGSIVYVEVTSSLLRDAAGHARYQLGLVSDLTTTERLRRRADEAHEALAATNERFAELEAHATELVAIVGADGGLLYASPSFRELTGEELSTGQHQLHRYFHPSDVARLGEAWSAVLVSPGSSTQLACRIRRHDGQWRDLRATLTNLSHLPPVGGVVINAHDVTHLVQAHRRLEHQATHDGLTGLANRTLLLDRARGAHPAALALLDIDAFGTVNERVGDLGGDYLLRTVAARLEEAASTSALVARTHGDEFAVLMPGLSDAAAAEAAAQRLLTAFERAFPLPGGGAIHLASHVGVAVTGVPRGATSLLREADLALSEARARRTGSVVVCDPPLRRRRARRVAIEAALADGALERQLEVHYQPIVELTSGRLTALEALLRWNHPTLGEILPDEAIPVAEATGAIVRVGSWMLRTASQQLADWKAEGLADDLRVSVNLSPRQFMDADLLPELQHVLETTGVPSDQLWLELTESAIGEEVDRAEQVLRRISELGVSVHIDDFGTGFSSLAHLIRFPVSGVKIDRSFVARLLDDRQTRAIVTTILDLGRSLRLHVVAEGVEQSAQQRWLREAGCATGQGFLWSRARPAPAIRRWLADGRALSSPA